MCGARIRPRPTDKSGVLAEHRRKNGADHEVLDGAIGGCGRVPFTIGRPTLPISRLAVLRLVDSGKQPPPGILHGIESTSGHDCKLLLRRQRRHLYTALQGQEIREGVKQSVLRSADVLLWSLLSGFPLSLSDCWPGAAIGRGVCSGEVAGEVCCSESERKLHSTMAVSLATNLIDRIPRCTRYD